MWTSSWAINGFLACGLTSLWPVHAMEHQLSAVYDVTHGHGLAVLTPVWMRYILNDDNVDRFVNYGMAERASDGLDECQVPLDKDKIVEIYRKCMK